MDSSKSHIKIPLTIILFGLVLMTYMIIVEDEPGALPLVLILSGITWYGVAKYFKANNKA